MVPSGTSSIVHQHTESTVATSPRSRFLDAISGHAVDRPPVWLMRQAGRYLPEYRELKTRHSFLALASTPELAAEVTLQPLRRFALDAAILFSDILFPVQSLGFKIDFNPGPQIENPIRSAEEIRALKHGDRTTFRLVEDALRLIRTELRKFPDRKALIGFAGSPWTLACYLIDQRMYKHFHGTQIFAKQHQTAFESFLALLTELVGDYLEAQAEAGADVLQLFDTWGGNLSREDYRRWSLPYSAQIIQRLQARGIPVALYTNGSSHLLQDIHESGADILSVDWRTSLSACQEIFGAERVLQGNFDPTDLFSSPAEIKEQVYAMLRSVCRSRYIVNLGHGVLPETPIENVQAMIDAVESFEAGHVINAKCDPVAVSARS